MTLYPICSSGRVTWREMRLLTSIRLLVDEKRGAETASTILISKSITFKMACRTPIAICVPPGAPITIQGCPSWKRIEGQIDENRPLPGEIDPARPGLGSKTPIHPLYMKPNPGVITPEGMPKEWVIETAFPSVSTTDI